MDSNRYISIEKFRNKFTLKPVYSSKIHLKMMVVKASANSNVEESGTINNQYLKMNN